MVRNVCRVYRLRRNRPFAAYTGPPLLLYGIAFSAVVAFSLMTACRDRSTYSNQELEQRTAQATETAKQRSKELVQNARVAAGQAEQDVNAVTTGVEHGLKSGQPAGDGGKVDLNTASQADLASLPGISPQTARRIIDHRPYRSTRQLVERGLLSEKEYTAISSEITAR